MEEIIEVWHNGRLIRLWAFVYYAMQNCKGS